MHAARKQFAPPYPPKTFVQLVRHNDGSAAHLIKTYDDTERPCWFLLKANALSLVKLARTAYEDMVDLTQFGEVLARGWGHEPGGDVSAPD